MKRTAALLAVGLVIVACSQSTGGGAAAPPPQPEPEPTLDPVGVYDFSTEVEGQTLTGTLTITGSPGAYSGSMSTDMMGTFPLRSFSVDGMDLMFMADLPDATVSFFLTFEGDSFTGEWDAGGMTGFMSGSKR
jgi:hypothetical protein